MKSISEIRLDTDDTAWERRLGGKWQVKSRLEAATATEGLLLSCLSTGDVWEMQPWVYSPDLRMPLML